MWPKSGRLGNFNISQWRSWPPKNMKFFSKTSQQLHVDSDKLLVKEEAKTPDQAATTELQVLEALKRRGVAFAFVDMMSWDSHERYLQTLFSHIRP